MTTSSLFLPTAPGPLSLRNRIAMAPMTRSRALGNQPNELMRDYYGQRSGAGLIISEGTSPSPEGLGYARIPGLFTQAQADGWRDIAQAAQAGGARLVVQLMHSGRVGSALNLPDGLGLLAPSAVAAAGQVWTDSAGMVDNGVPTAMDEVDLARVRADFVQAAKLAVAAGVDGIELHAANGYLLAQFLNPRSNLRTDQYGGSAENRRRFLLEIVDAVSAAIGAARVAVRLSPFNAFNDLEVGFPGELAEVLELIGELSQRGIGYLNLIVTPEAPAELQVAARAAFPGVLLRAGNFDRERAEAALDAGLADVIAFGRPFIGNPDLPLRLLHGLPLAAFDPATLYSAGAEGYSDYPAGRDGESAAA